MKRYPTTIDNINFNLTFLSLIVPSPKKFVFRETGA
jgi:hypothetical protein